MFSIKKHEVMAFMFHEKTRRGLMMNQLFDKHHMIHWRVGCQLHGLCPPKIDGDKHKKGGIMGLVNMLWFGKVKWIGNLVDIKDGFCHEIKSVRCYLNWVDLIPFIQPLTFLSIVSFFTVLKGFLSCCCSKFFVEYSTDWLLAYAYWCIVASFLL